MIVLYFASDLQISHGHSGMTNRGAMGVVGNPGFSSSTHGVGGSIPGILPTSASIGNRSAVPGMGVSQMLGNAGPRITSSMGNMVGGSNIGRSISSGGGLSVPGLASRLNLTGNSGSGNISVQGPNRMMSGVLQQGILPLIGDLFFYFLFSIFVKNQKKVKGLEFLANYQ